MSEDCQPVCDWDQLIGSFSTLHLDLYGIVSNLFDLNRYGLPVLEDIRDAMPGGPIDYRPQFQSMASCLCEIPATIAARVGLPLDSIASHTRRRTEQVDGLLKMVGGLAGLDFGKLAGDAPDVREGTSGTLVGAFAQAQLDATKAMFKHESPGLVDDLVSDVGQTLAIQLDRFIPTYSPEVVNAYVKGDPSRVWPGVAVGLMDAAKTALTDFYFDPDTMGSCAVDKVWGRALKTYGTAVGLGVAAHAISGIMSTKVLGNLGLNFTGLAAVIGKFAGFDPIINAVQGNFYKAYLDIPMGYYMNSKLTPIIPDIGTLMEMRFKSRKSEKMDAVKTKEGFFKMLSYYGFSPEWCENIEDHLYKEPRYFEAMVMAESDQAMADEDWLDTKTYRMGYTEQDANYFKDGMKRKLSRGFIEGWGAQLMRQVPVGLLTPDELVEQVKEAGFAPLSVDFMGRSAREAWHMEEVCNTVYEAKQMYARNELNAEELGLVLEGVGLRTEKVEHIVNVETLKRFHKVWLTTPTEEARKAVSWYRTAYRSNLITGAQYRLAMEAAGLADEVVELRMTVDAHARDKTVVGELRKYALPGLRDDLLSGGISIDGYRAKLVGLFFPDYYLAAEVGFARALLARHLRSRVEQYQLPQYERAYVLGLIARDPLVRVYAEAGLSESETAPRLAVLADLRDEEARRRAKRPDPRVQGAGGGPPNVAAAEWRYVAGELDAAALRKIYLQVNYAPDRVASRFTALEALRQPPVAAAS